MDQTMFSIYQNKPAPTALELSLPWKQKRLQSQESSMDKNSGKDSYVDEPAIDEEAQLAHQISNFSCLSPSHCDISPSPSPNYEPQGKLDEESLTSHSASHIPPADPVSSQSKPHHPHGVPKVFSMNDMDQSHFHVTAIALQTSTNSCCGLTDLSGTSPPASSSHLPWRDQRDSERPLRCSESHINCITANDIESHHRQCIASNNVMGELHENEMHGTPFLYCCESGLSRRRSMHSFHQTSVSSHHNLHDFPHHAHMHHVHHHHYHGHLFCHGSRKPFNILGEDEIDILPFSPRPINEHDETERFYNHLEDRVRSWFEKMDTEGVQMTVEEQEKPSQCSMSISHKEEEEDPEDFGSDARDMLRLYRCGNPIHKFIVESSSSQYRKQSHICCSPQTIAPTDAISLGASPLYTTEPPLPLMESFTDYSDINQSTLHANPRF